MNRLTAAITVILSLSATVIVSLSMAAPEDAQKISYQQNMQERIDDLRSRTESLHDKVTSETPDVLQRLHSNLQNTQRQLDEKWEEFKDTNTGTWQNLRDGLSQAVENVEELYQSLEQKYFVWSTQKEVKAYQTRVRDLDDDLVQLDLNRKVIVEEKIASIHENAETVEQKLEIYDKSGSKDIQQEINLALHNINKLYEEVNQDINTN